MSDHMIEVEVRIDQTVETQVHVSDVVQAMNHLPLASRWNAVSKIINHIALEDIEQLTNQQKEIIQKWLAIKINQFK